MALRPEPSPVPRLADVRSMPDELVPGGVDVVDGEHQVQPGAGGSRRQALAELDRRWRAGRRELHDTGVRVDREVGVETPAESLVEGLCAVDVGNRQHGDLEPHRDARGAGRFGRGVSAHLRTAHGDLRGWSGPTLTGPRAGRARGAPWSSPPDTLAGATHDIDDGRRFVS